MPAWRRLPRPLSTTAVSRLLLADLISALTLLTRLPVARFAAAGGPPDLARCVWAFPLAGGVVNGIGGLAYWLAHRFGVPPLLAAAWTLAATIAITGGFHEDGLADTADGFGGGAGTARKMEIMRDSHIGSYGVLALVLSVTARAAAIAALGRPAVMTGMIVAGMLGRGGILLLLLLLAPVRSDGMGAAVAKPRPESAAVGLALGILGPLLSLPIVPAIAAIVLGLGATMIVAKLAAAQIGGHTGDVLGAGEVVTECVVLTVLASSFSA